MKKVTFLVSALLLAFSLATANGVQNNTNASGTKTKTKTSKPKPTTDADIQKCISDSFANGEKMKNYGLSASVSGGVATLTGTVPNGGAKGNATSTAKRCGAKSVTNNITVTPKEKKTKTANANKKM